MAEQTPAGAPTLEPSPNLAIHKLYIKDLSFENPSAPVIYNESGQPQFEVNVNNTGRKVGDFLYEVVLSVTATARVAEQVAFLIEVQQAGLFEIRDVPDEAMGLVLGATCPGILFPYARETISDMTTRGGFPPLLLAPTDFDSVYQQRLAESVGTA